MRGEHTKGPSQLEHLRLIARPGVSDVPAGEYKRACEEAAATISDLLEALEPFVSFIEQYDLKPLALGDEFYAIHMGTEWEASLKLSDLRKARAALLRARGERNEQ